MRDIFGLSIPQSLEDLCVPERAALIVYDMQVGVVRQVADGAAIVAKVAALLDAARAGGFRVFFMRHAFLPKRYLGVAGFRRAMAWQRTDDPAAVEPFFLPSSPAHQIVPELAPREDEVVIDKITMSAFAGTYLEIALRDAHLDTIVIAGIAMEIGIEPTVRHALDLNIVPIVVSDACGFGHAEAATRSHATLAFTGEVVSADLARVTAVLRRASH